LLRATAPLGQDTSSPAEVSDATPDPPAPPPAQPSPAPAQPGDDAGAAEVRPDAAAAFFAGYGEEGDEDLATPPPALGDGPAALPGDHVNAAILAVFVFGAASRPAEPEGTGQRRKPSPAERNP
jgi:hypothetical protein